MAKVVMVGALDAEALEDLNGAPCIVLHAESLDELRLAGGRMFETVDIVARRSSPPSGAAKEGT